MDSARETDLYLPIKRFLEQQGYTVKSEVGAADVMAVRGAEPPLVIELKMSLSLVLFHQAVARLAAVDDVYIAVAHRSGKRFSRSIKNSVALARRVGLGVMTIRLSDGLVLVYCDPGASVPRKSRKGTQVLLREFSRRQGDPNTGGQTRVGLVTAYRQDALRLAEVLARAGASRGADVARETGVGAATRMLRDNHYGWFEKVSRGVYRLSPAGREALVATACQPPSAAGRMSR